ncbi:FmdB family zinc ribbon protein [Antrihabitans stalactiti]|uniref:Zinc ribbon domain-containing protein n=1 Tax=Antrihabitans stalactiti TaxID=2584121 RepID=A0A848KJ58_9NOCA|nr:zinc ribbon domain-containing protein [Antrihabitans stalactiti]NMN97848.1 zinc ribbon domain-containing protein [Antrihabitans stalactiti]
MPRYEYRCRSCGDTFDVTRSMSESSVATPCPQGHDDTVKLLTTLGLAGKATPAAAPQAQAGGGC